MRPNVMRGKLDAEHGIEGVMHKLEDGLLWPLHTAPREQGSI